MMINLTTNVRPERNTGMYSSYGTSMDATPGSYSSMIGGAYQGGMMGYTDQYGQPYVQTSMDQPPPQGSAPGSSSSPYGNFPPSQGSWGQG